MKRTPRRRSACRSCISEGALSDISFASTKSTPLSTNDSLFKKPELSNTQVTAALGGMQIQHLNDKNFMLVDTDDTIVYSYKEACFAEKTQRKEKIPTQAITGSNGVKGRFRYTVKCKPGTSCLNSMFFLLIIMFLYYGISNFEKNLSGSQSLSEYFRKTFAQESTVPVDGINNVIVEDHPDSVVKSAIKNILNTNERLYKEVKFWRRQQIAFKTELAKLKLLFNLMKQPQDDVTVELAEKKGCISKEPSSSCLLCPGDEFQMPDFALEASGGTVISTPQTETLQLDSWYYVLGIPLFRHTKSPRSVIQRSVAPGECWPFRGTSGSVVIQLAARITITAVAMEHISAAMSLTGKVDSAPKTFSVFGLNSYNEEGVALGSFYYNISHSPLQTFFINQQNTEQQGPFSAVKLWVTSNHGNPEYTCVYRFRVHGTLYSERKIIT